MCYTRGSYFVHRVLMSVVTSSDEHRYLIEAGMTTNKLWLSFRRVENLSLIQGSDPAVDFTQLSIQ